MKIGFIGLGVMGSAMSTNIIKKHDDTVYVFDVEQDKREAMEKQGARKCKSAAEVAARADCIFTIVPRSEHVRQVYSQMMPALGPGKICVEMSTIEPAVSRMVAEEVQKTGAEYADCPVVKSQAAAIAGELGIFMGGTKETYEKIHPILEYMGKNIVRMGNVGSGIVMKVCHNTLVHEIQHAVNETLTLAQLNGISVDAFVEAVSYGGGKNYYLDSKADALRREDWTCAFPVEYAAKDLLLGKNLGESCGLRMTGAEAALDNMNQSIAMGYGRLDSCASILSVKAAIKSKG